MKVSANIVVNVSASAVLMLFLLMFVGPFCMPEGVLWLVQPEGALQREDTYRAMLDGILNFIVPVAWLFCAVSATVLHRSRRIQSAIPWCLLLLLATVLLVVLDWIAGSHTDNHLLPSLRRRIWWIP